MKFDEELLKQFNLEQPIVREPINVMKVKDVLSFLKNCSDRISLKSSLYAESDDPEVKMDCIDIVTAKLNDFTQAFKDIVVFISRKEGEQAVMSLRYCISSFVAHQFPLTDEGEGFLKELLLRNEITHDYFNQEIHQQKLIWVMENCSSGAIDVYGQLHQYCCDNELLEDLLNKNN